MSKSTISTFQLFALIPDAETARVYLETRQHGCIHIDTITYDILKVQP